MTSIARIAIEYRPGEWRAAAIDADGRVVEFRVERTHNQSLVGGVYLGRVRAVRSEINAAFVDIGHPQDAFLNIRRGKAGEPARDSLGVEIVEGAAILVQTNRDATTDKGARLTLHTTAEIGDRAAGAPCPTCLVDPPALPVRVIRDWHTSDVRQIVVDDSKTLTEVRTALGEQKEDDQPEIELVQGMTAFEAMGVAEFFEDQLSPVVRLPGGGSIIIEHTSAMTTIDVNVGQGQEANAARLAMSTNIEAVTATAEALRLRGIGGLIAIDFLKMTARADNERIVQSLRDALVDDPVKSHTTNMSAFGIVEIARNRTSDSLAATYLQTRSTPSPTTLALNALYDVRKRRGASATITAPRDVIAELKGPLKPAMTEIEAELGFVIQLETSPDTAGTTYSVA